MTTIQNAFDSYDKDLAKSKRQYSGLLGLATDGHQTVNVASRNGYVYVRLRDNLSEVLQAYNDKVSPVYNFPVIVERKGNRWIVVGKDISRYENWGTDYPFLPAHGDTHSFNRDGGGGGDVVGVYPDQFMPLLVYPSGTYGAGNLQIAPYVLQRANDFIYVGNTGTPNLLPFRPTNNQAIMGLVYIDTVSGVPGVLIGSGTPFSGAVTGTASVVQYLPNPSATQEPLYGFRLVSGTSALTWSNLYNVRQFYGGGSSSTGTSGVSDHELLTGLLGGSANNHYHLTPSQVNGLVSGSSTSLHSHAGGGASPGGVNTSIQYNNTGTFGGDSAFTFKDTDKSINLGPTLSALPSQPGSLSQGSTGTSVANFLETFGDTATVASYITLLRGRGDNLNPTAVLKDDVLGRIRGRAVDGAGTVGNTSAEIRMLADENHTPTAHATRIEMYTIPSGTTTLRKAGTFKHQRGTDIEAGLVMPYIGVPILSTLRDDFTTRGSAGVSDGTITYVSTGTSSLKISVQGGEGYIRTTNSQQGDLVFCKWPTSVDLFTFTGTAAGQENKIFIGIEYSGGVATAVSKAAFTDWNWYTNFPLARASYDGTTVRIVSLYAHSEDTANLTRKYLRLVFPLRREESPEGSGGLEISASGANQMSMTAGKMWHGFNNLSLNAITAATTFYTYYRRAGGGFTGGTAVAWEATKYDDGSGTLATMTNNRYGTRWIYLDVSGNTTVGAAYNGSLAMVYGTSNATSVALAQAEGAPSLPDHLTYHGRLIGRIIFQKSATAATLVESAWTSVFSASVVGDHNLLTSLNGTSPYYHLPTPTAPAANLMNVAGIVNGETDWSNKPLFDAVTPAGIGSAGAAGTSLLAPHRDHIHAIGNIQVNGSLTGDGSVATPLSASSGATTATAAGTTTLTVASMTMQEFTGATTQTIVLPVVTTLRLGHRFTIVNNSSGTLTVNSSGGNLVKTILSENSYVFYCVAITGTGIASWAVFVHEMRVQTEGSTFSIHANINFSGEGVTPTDDAVNDAVKITIPSPYITVKNTSGATVSAGDVGYINSAGEFKTTTTAQDTIPWCAVVRGAPNTGDVLVTRRGRMTLNYTGTAPSAGHYLSTSTSAGLAQRETVMHPAIFAVCTGAGGGGTVEAQLLCNTTFRPLVKATDILRVNASSNSNFVATINGAPGATTVVYNAPSSGEEVCIKPVSASEVGNLVLANTTRGTSALIDSVDTGTNTITLTAAVPAGWANTDSITCRSQTSSGAFNGTSYLFEIDLTGCALTLTRAIALSCQAHDTGTITGNVFGFIHKLSASPTFGSGISWIADWSHVILPGVELVSNKIMYCIGASGTGAFNYFIVRLNGVWEATP